MTPEQDSHNAVQYLQWYAQMGVDEAVAAAPLDWFDLSAKRAEAAKKAREERSAGGQGGRPSLLPSTPQKQQTRSAARPSSAASSQNSHIAPNEALLSAKELASKASNLQELEQIVRDFDGCALKATAKNTCFKRGTDEARIMFIGEGPGRDEDIQGRPFVGKAGQLLDKMLAAVDLSEDQVYITNIVYWRPPGNRTPTPQEVAICAPFLDRQIELLDPALVVMIGAPSSHHILDTTAGITKLRGKWKETEIGGKTRQCLPILHPAYLLRTPAAKKLAWHDMLMLRDKFDALED